MNTSATQPTAAPEPEQMAAIVRFAQRHGRNWKAALRSAWASGKDDSMPDGHLLRQVRNQLGPNWLQTFLLSPSVSTEGAASAQTGIFTTPYNQYADRKGQAFTVLGVVDPATYDADECGVMYRIQFEDGAEIEAWPEEVASALQPLSVETVQALLANCGESSSAASIGFYPDVGALVEKVRSSKCWTEGEVFGVRLSLRDHEAGRARQLRNDEFTDDPAYWEKGTCYATESEMPNATATVKVSREGGQLNIEELLEGDDATITVEGGPQAVAPAGLPSADTENAEMLVSLDGGQTFVPVTGGVRIIYKNVAVPGEGEPGELHLNATSEGLISDLWVSRDEHLDHNLGTSAQMVDDLVERLVDDPVDEDDGPPRQGM